MYFVGIDAGASHSRAVLANEDGLVLAQTAGPPASLALGAESVWLIVSSLIAELLTSIGDHGDRLRPCTVCLAAAGSSRQDVVSMLLHLGRGLRSFTVVSDAAAALDGAHGGNDGAVLILGTGSILLGRTGTRRFRIGGFGFPVGDYASAAHAGLLAAQAVAKFHDRLVRSGPLVDELSRSFFPDRPTLVAWTDKARSREYGMLAPLVSRCAKEGDLTAQRIMRRCASHASDYIRVARRHDVHRVAIVGGFSNSVKGWMTSEALQGVVDPLGNAVDGALALALSKNL